MSIILPPHHHGHLRAARRRIAHPHRARATRCSRRPLASHQRKPPRCCGFRVASFAPNSSGSCPALARPPASRRSNCTRSDQARAETTEGADLKVGTYVPVSGGSPATAAPEVIGSPAARRLQPLSGSRALVTTRTSPPGPHTRRHSKDGLKRRFVFALCSPCSSSNPVSRRLLLNLRKPLYYNELRPTTILGLEPTTNSKSRPLQ
jgi:hypothetical protein